MQILHELIWSESITDSKVWMKEENNLCKNYVLTPIVYHPVSSVHEIEQMLWGFLTRISFHKRALPEQKRREELWKVLWI